MNTIKLITFAVIATLVSSMIVSEANAKSALYKVSLDKLTAKTPVLALQLAGGELVKVKSEKLINGLSQALLNDQVIELSSGETLTSPQVDYILTKESPFSSGNSRFVPMNVVRAPRDEE